MDNRTPRTRREVVGAAVGAAIGAASVLFLASCKAARPRVSAGGPPARAGTAAPEVASFTRDFSRMIDSGTSLVRSLDTLAQSQSDPRFRQAIVSIRQEVEQGSTLSRAMSMHPDYFDPSYVDAVRQGEKSGTLEVALQRLAQR